MRATPRTIALIILIGLASSIACMSDSPNLRQVHTRSLRRVHIRNLRRVHIRNLRQVHIRNKALRLANWSIRGSGFSVPGREDSPP